MEDLMNVKELPVSGCEGCPCHFVDISEVGYPPEDRCNLLDRQVFVIINRIDPECPLKNWDYLLHFLNTDK